MERRPPHRADAAALARMHAGAPPAAAAGGAALEPELIEAFGVEARESLHICEELLLQLLQQPNSDEVRFALLRRLHTLKSAAAAAGLEAMAAQIHNAESLLEAAATDRTDDDHLTALLLQLTDVVASLVGEVSLLCMGGARHRAPVAVSPAGARRLPASRLQAVSLEAAFRRLHPAVREAARREGKLAELRLQGGAFGVSQSVVKALFGPLLHLVRNAVAHGIEAPAKRTAAGKPTAGTVCVAGEIGPDGDLLVSVADDGRGLDFAAISAQAHSRQLIPATAEPSRDELLRLIFHPGFSTRAQATDVAGRGVGLDVVVHEVTALRGQIAVSSADGVGTTVRLSIPRQTWADAGSLP